MTTATFKPDVLRLCRSQIRASISDLTALGGISYKYSYYESQNGTDTLVSGDDANSEQNADATVKNVLGYMLPYVNIMLLYFLILFYGQGTANCVVLEKSSKLMDTMLVSVKPEAMVIGKVLAQAFTCVIQIALWVIGLWGGFAAGIWAVKQSIHIPPCRSSRCLVIWDCSQASLHRSTSYFSYST